MKHHDVSAIEVILDTDEGVICSDILGCGTNKFCFRIATPEFLNVCVHGSDVYICIKNPIATSLKKPF